jgi:hypothetical protein
MAPDGGLTVDSRQDATDHLGTRGHTGRGLEVLAATGADRAIGGPAALEAPALGGRAGIDRVAADRVQERRHCRLRLHIVARDREGAPLEGSRMGGPAPPGARGRCC